MRRLIDPSASSFEQIHRDFRWNVPEYFNIGVAVCDSHTDRMQDTALYWEHEGNRAVRVGDWKLVAKGSKKDRYEPVQWELFNVVKDRIEANDLIATETVRAQELKQLWQSYADRCNVFPAPKKVKKIKEKAKKKQPEKVPAAK